MKLTSLVKAMSASAVFALSASAFASAGIIHHGVVPNQHALPVPQAVGIRGNTTCPSEFFECVEISKTSAVQQEWCIAYSGTSDCTDLFPGTWTWDWPTFKVGKKGIGKATTKIKASSTPNPGNPTTLTISTKSKKSSKGKIKYAVELISCNSSSSCLSGYYIGVSVL